MSSCALPCHVSSNTFILVQDTLMARAAQDPSSVSASETAPARHRARRLFPCHRPRPGIGWTSSFGSASLVLQLAQLYFWAGWLKNDPSRVSDRNALELALA